MVVKNASKAQKAKAKATRGADQTDGIAQGPTGANEPKKKRKKTKKKSSGLGGGVTSVKDYADEIESSGAAWFESSQLELAKWMGVLTIIALTLSGYLEAQAAGWKGNGVPTDPCDSDWTSYHENGVDLSNISKIFLWAKGLAIGDGDIREVFKLAASFVTAGSFIGACNKVFTEARLNLSYTTESWTGCMMNLMSSRASIRREIRKEAASLKVKEAKTPKQVIDLDNDIAALAKVLRGEDKKRREAVEVLRKAYKKAVSEESKFKEETTPLRDYIKEYYTEKAGYVSAQTRVALVKRYNLSEQAQALYTLEQYVNLYGMKQSSKRIELKVASFRSDPRFKDAVQWADKLENDSDRAGAQEDDDMEDEDAGELDESLLENGL